MKNIFFLLLALATLGCKEPKEPQQVQQTEAAAPVADGTKLMHLVFFDLKEGITEAETAQFLAALESLSQINYVKSVKAGTPAETGYPRLAKGYDAVLQMGFASQGDLARYQQDSLHLKVKNELAALLAGPPLVYDYFVEQ